jgi:hypothetical protein
MISLSVSFDLWIHEYIDPVQSKIKHKSSVFVLAPLLALPLLLMFNVYCLNDLADFFELIRN